MPCASSSIEGFMRSHGRSKPDYVPDARVIFDPSSDETQSTSRRFHHINMFRKTEYMLSNREHEPLHG